MDSPLCRLCDQKGETINHIISKYNCLAQKEFKRRHDCQAGPLKALL